MAQMKVAGGRYVLYCLVVRAAGVLKWGHCGGKSSHDDVYECDPVQSQ